MKIRGGRSIFDYVIASPTDVESSVRGGGRHCTRSCGIDTDILLKIKDDIFVNNCSNVKFFLLLKSKIKRYPVPHSDVMNKFFPPLLLTFSWRGDKTLNILPTHPALQLDFNFIPSNDLGSDLDVSSPFGDSNKIYDLGICIEVESTRFLALLSHVIDTLLTFSSENKDKVFNHGVLTSKEKSPSSPSHRGLKAFQLSLESPMLIHGDNTPNLGVRHPHFYPP
ncbi:hypothetical protein Tco_0826603 [Tanacetum coccineum]